MTGGHVRTHRPDAVAPRQTRKLSLGPMHDARETEASRIAALVSAHEVPRAPLRVQHGGGGQTEDGIVPPSVHATLGTSGQPLDGSTRAFMEQRFGHRLDYVRVSDGALAARSAREIGALAYTVGSDIVPDRRPVAIANRQGPYQQHGQRAYRLELYSGVLNDPQSAQEANRLFAGEFRRAHFHATGTPIIRRTPVSGGHDISIDISGRSSPPGQQPFNDTFTMTMNDPEPTDSMVRAEARRLVPNPGRYAWTLQRVHASNGLTTRTVVAERVVAYLHHQSPDPSAHDHFTRPESDPSFFSTSRFAPPRPRAVRPRRRARP